MVAEATSAPDDCWRITMALATGAALCVSCIAQQTGMSTDAVERTMLRIGRTLRVETGGTPCDSCRTVLMVYRLA